MLAGKDVLVEKPLAMTKEECKELVSISDKSGSGLMVGHIFRFHSALLELKKKIDFSVPDEITLINSYLNVKSINDKKSYDVVSGGNFTVRLEFKEPLLEEIRHFIIKSLKDKNYRANGKIGSRAVEMVEKAILSNETKQFVRC